MAEFGESLSQTKGLQAFELAHTTSDVDFEPSSFHHTLGKSPLQAAPGNHTHDLRLGGVAIYLGDVIPPKHLALDGAVINKADYPEFFAAVGVTTATLDLPFYPEFITRVKK